MSSGRWRAATLGVMVVALAIRLTGWPDVLVGDGGVVLRIGDAHGHARRAAVTFRAFPRVLLFDSYLNYPDGAAVPSPPLYDAALGAVARVLGRSEWALSAVLVGVSPLLGMLAVLPIVAVGRRLGGARVGLGAGLLYALFPVIALSSRIGDPDHHAAISLLGALWLWLGTLALAEPDASRRLSRRLLWVGGLAAVRAALMLSWGGSLAYSVAADATLLLVAAAFGRADVLCGLAASSLASAGLVLPVVAVLPTPTWGAWSSGALSLMQPASALALAGVAGAGAWLEWRAPGRPAALRLARLAGVGALVGLPGLLVPGLWAGLVFGLGFVGGSGPGQGAIVELLALLPVPGRLAVASPTALLGGFAWLVPLAPLAPWLLWRDPARREPAVWTSAMCAVFALLFVLQYRFGTEFAAPGAVAFAVGLGEIARRVARRAGAPSLAPWLAFAAGALAMIPALTQSLLPAVGDSLHAHPGPALERRLASAPGTLDAFMRDVRAHTPETSGWLGDGRPEYGILVPANLGHALQAVAHRASPASGYMHLAGPKQLAATEMFFSTRQERQALAIAEQLASPFVVTYAFPGQGRDSLGARLQFDDGSATREMPALEHFRLLIEAPARGRGLIEALGPDGRAGNAPYKLFQVVEGAVLAVTAKPGSDVDVSVRLDTPAGRSLVWRSGARVGANGTLRLRVPYSTAGTPDGVTRALGPYRIDVDGTEAARVDATEEAVWNGRTIPVDAASPRPAGDRYPSSPSEPR